MEKTNSDKLQLLINEILIKRFSIPDEGHITDTNNIDKSKSDYVFTIIKCNEFKNGEDALNDFERIKEKMDHTLFGNTLVVYYSKIYAALERVYRNEVEIFKTLYLSEEERETFEYPFLPKLEKSDNADLPKEKDLENTGIPEEKESENADLPEDESDDTGLSELLKLSIEYREQANRRMKKCLKFLLAEICSLQNGLKTNNPPPIEGGKSRRRRSFSRTKRNGRRNKRNSQSTMRRRHHRK